MRNIILAVAIIVGLIILGILTDSGDNEMVLEGNDYNQEIDTDSAMLEDVVVESEKEEDVVAFDNGFKHTVPGEYSEIFVVATGLTPGKKYIAYVKNMATEEYEPGQELFPDEFGVVNTRFRITSYGDWEVSVGSHTDIVTVE